MIDDLLHGWAQLQAAAPGYEEAERYHSGEVAEVFASPRIRQVVEATGERYRFNLAKTPVNVMADRVGLNAITAPDDQAASALIEQIWDANDLDVHYPDLFQKMFTYGDSYLQVWPVVAEAENADDELVVAGVELTVHNPKHCRVIYDPENARRKAFTIKRWALRIDGQDMWRVDLYYADVIERWVSLAGANLAAADGWTPFFEEDSSEEDWLIENIYGEIPFFHYRNALPYGVPEHRAGYGCQDAVNKMLITQLTTTDSHGWPQRYSLTDAGAELDQAASDDDWDDTPEQGGLVRDRAEQSAGPGSMMEFVGKKAVGQFPAADPKVFLAPAELYIRLMAQLTTTPLHYFDPTGAAPSGESLRVAEAPLVKKVQRVEVMLRGSVAETWVFALRLLNRAVARIDVRWAPVASASGASDWEVVAAKQRAGVPVDQTLMEAGYESEVVKTWLDDAPEAMDLAARLELVRVLSEALPRLGDAVEKGILSQADASAVVSQLIAQTVPAPGETSVA